ncbi:NmrA-like domain [Dillenia turbinata]|uniref:NmrA-like domain n=1 Tax=Dillenia turbinata TaxID=194707 RepID=A0AAN8W4S9_9MAGN
MTENSKILIVGVTGNLGHEIAKASLQYGHPTFALVRDSAFSDPLKSLKLQSLQNSGATLLKGSLEDEPSLIEAVKKVDVVICAASAKQVLDQKLLIKVIKQVGSIKRFIPSEFGADPDKVQIIDSAYNFYKRKAEIRRLVEAEGIPHTYISCNFFTSVLLPSLVQPGLETPPRDKVTIYGDGNVKGVFVKESDVAAFTINTVDDPRTLNKVLYLRPPGNVYSMNELVEIWENQIGRKLEKIYKPKDELLKRIAETPYPSNMLLIFLLSAFVMGDHTYFDIESSCGVDGTKLYPHVKYTTISEYLDTLVHEFAASTGKSDLDIAGKSKILIIGGTGYIGKFIVEASVKTGHQTFVIVRESTFSNPEKLKLVEGFKNAGVTLIYGDINDHRSLVNAIKQVDVVISTLGHAMLADQVKIIAAIKEAGNVKRFFPSEFGNDADRVQAVEPAKTVYDNKAQIRRKVEAEGIPYTYVSSNFFAGYFLSTLSQFGAVAPPRDRVVILGDGNPKVIFNDEVDIGTYTIKAVDDPRTLNKTLYIRPLENVYSFNELVSLWEKKIGRSLLRTHVLEEQLMHRIREAPFPLNVKLSIGHAVYVKGVHTNFEIESSFGVEATDLYPDIKYKTVDEYLDQFV